MYINTTSCYHTWARPCAISLGPKKEWRAQKSTPKKWAHKGQLPIFQFEPVLIERRSLWRVVLDVLTWKKVFCQGAAMPPCSLSSGRRESRNVTYGSDSMRDELEPP